MALSSQSKNTIKTVCITLCVAALLFVLRNRYTSQKVLPSQVSDTVDTWISYKVWEPVVLEWSIKKLETLKAYTHTLTNDWWLVWLKSSTKNLYDFGGTVSIKWSVVDMKKDVAIIEVDEIIQSNNEGDVTWFDTNEKISYLPQLWLLLDLSETTWYNIDIGTDSIKIVDTTGTGNTVLTINPYTCTPWDWLKDCDQLLERFGDDSNQQFTSANDITYYNMTETNTRLAFNPRKIGYYFIPGTDNDIASFVDLISFLDNSTISQNTKTNALSTCKNLNGAIQDNETLKVTLWETKSWLTQATVIWNTSNWDILSCVYQIKLWNDLEYKLLSTNESEWKTQDKDDSDIDNTQEDENTKNNDETNTDTVIENNDTPEPIITAIGTAISRVNNLRVRSTNNSTIENIIWWLDINQTVEVISVEDNRAQIIYNWSPARVSRQFLDITLSSTDTQWSNTDTKVDSIITSDDFGFSRVAGLRVRSAATTQIDNIIWSLDLWQKVGVLSTQNERVEIIYNNSPARVQKQYMDLRITEQENIPQVEQRTDTVDTTDPIIENTQEESEDVEEAIIEDTAQEWTNEKTDTQEQEPTIPVNNGGTSYTSSLWYTLSFSDKNIAFDGTTTTFLYDGCTQAINIISWANATKVNTSPDVIVHVCPSETPSAGDYIWTQGNKYFYTESKTNNLNMTITVWWLLE